MTTTLPNFMVSCPTHLRAGDQGCTRCRTAADVNTAGHLQRNCVPGSCWWCFQGFQRGSTTDLVLRSTGRRQRLQVLYPGNPLSPA